MVKQYTRNHRGRFSKAVSVRHFVKQQAQRVFGYTKDEIERFFLHVPVGVLAAVLTLWDAPLGLGFSGAFLFYEGIQDWKKDDWSYKDVFGFMAAYGVTGLLLWLLET